MKDNRLDEKLERIKYMEVVCVAIKEKYWIGIMRSTPSIIIRGSYTLKHKMSPESTHQIGHIKSSKVILLEEPLKQTKDLVGRSIICKVIDKNNDLIVNVEGVAFYGIEKEPIEQLSEEAEAVLSSMQQEYGIRKEIWQTYMKAYPIKVHNAMDCCFIKTPIGNWMIDTEGRKLYHANQGGRSGQLFQNAKGLKQGYHLQQLKNRGYEAMISYIIQHDFYCSGISVVAPVI